MNKELGELYICFSNFYERFNRWPTYCQIDWNSWKALCEELKRNLIEQYIIVYGVPVYPYEGYRLPQFSNEDCQLQQEHQKDTDEFRQGDLFQ